MESSENKIREIKTRGEWKTYFNIWLMWNKELGIFSIPKSINLLKIFVVVLLLEWKPVNTIWYWIKWLLF